MAARICGWCGVRAHMTGVIRHSVEDVVIYGDPSRYVVDDAYSCDNCGRLSVVTWWSTEHPDSHNSIGEPADYSDQIWNPPPRVGEAFPDVPETISSLAQEACLCRNANAFRGAVALARAVIESTAKAQGKPDGTLIKKIDWMADQGHIRAAVAESAHEIRLTGNETAHSDLVASVGAEECEEVLALMKDVLAEVYESSARRERVRSAREARQRGDASST